MPARCPFNPHPSADCDWPVYHAFATTRLASGLLSPPTVHGTRILCLPSLELDHSAFRQCQPNCASRCSNVCGLTHLFVRSLYSTRQPQSLHRMGSAFLRWVEEPQSPHRYFIWALSSRKSGLKALGLAARVAAPKLPPGEPVGTV